MKPGMRMMAMDRMRQGDGHKESEYGGNTKRRMIGYDRDEPQGEYGRMPMRHIPPNNTDRKPADVATSAAAT